MASRPTAGGGGRGPFRHGIDWGRLWSYGRLTLGLSEEEFWHLTPLELDVLTHAYQAKRRLDVLPMAVLVHLTANINRDLKQRPTTFSMDEVLGWMGIAPEPDPPPPAPPTPEELRAKLGMLAQMFPKVNGQQHEGS